MNLDKWYFCMSLLLHGLLECSNTNEIIYRTAQEICTSWTSSCTTSSTSMKCHDDVTRHLILAKPYIVVWPNNIKKKELTSFSIIGLKYGVLSSLCAPLATWEGHGVRDETDCRANSCWEPHLQQHYVSSEFCCKGWRGIMEVEIWFLKTIVVWQARWNDKASRWPDWFTSTSFINSFFN